MRMGSAIRPGGLVVVLALLLGCATSPPAASPSLTAAEQLRKARCARALALA